MRYYAIAQGRGAPAILDNWPQAKRAVHQVSGAVYKAFDSHQEAATWLARQSAEKKDAPLPANVLHVYSDGSWHDASRTASYGFAVYADPDGDPIHTECGLVDPATVEAVMGDEICPDNLMNMRNIAGEVFGVLQALFWVMDAERPMVLYHDYTGLAHWVQGSWTPRNPYTEKYTAILREFLDYIVRFVHVKGHTGIPGNELADTLAKQALEPVRAATQKGTA